jgi:hypothetical protein
MLLATASSSLNLLLPRLRPIVGLMLLALELLGLTKVLDVMVGAGCLLLMFHMQLRKRTELSM